MNRPAPDVLPGDKWGNSRGVQGAGDNSATKSLQYVDARLQLVSLNIAIPGVGFFPILDS